MKTNNMDQKHIHEWKSVGIQPKTFIESGSENKNRVTVETFACTKCDTLKQVKITIKAPYLK